MQITSSKCNLNRQGMFVKEMYTALCYAKLVTAYIKYKNMNFLLLDLGINIYMYVHICMQGQVNAKHRLVRNILSRFRKRFESTQIHITLRLKF